MSNISLITRINQSFKKHAKEVALEFLTEKYTYKELDDASQYIAHYLANEKANEEIIGVWAKKEFFTYAAIVGILKSGRTYMPLNPKFPAERNQQILQLSEVKTVLEKSLKPKENNTLVLSETKPNSPAYLLFTSGSTGVPKGVLINEEQLLTYLNNIAKKVKVEPGNKCSHTFDLTFDLSIHDIFHTLLNGATLCVPAENELLSPASYIKNREITHWFSVPSHLLMMEKLRQLKEHNFPSIVSALFCGEALSSARVKKFMQAISPGAKTLNLYGPTEATIAITSYALESNVLEKNDKVCLGKIFDDNVYTIDEETSELWLKGKQVIERYFNNTVADAHQFQRNEPGEVWYKTGDLVEEKNGLLFYLGRKDTQVKINGYRVELSEIEHAVKSITNSTNAVCVYTENNNKTYLLVAIEGTKKKETTEILERCKEKLPAYMIPQQIIYLPSFPLNSNGKTDRKKIAEFLNKSHA